MTTETITLSSFLLARLADEEDAARSALTVGEPWRATLIDPQSDAAVQGAYVVAERADGRWAVAYCTHPPHAAHIARHDPARVLAECAAKRAIVEMFTADYDERGLPSGAGGYGEAYCEALQHLAAVYSDHPDYREAWRP